MERYRVKISTPGAKIVFRSKVARTPVEFKNVTDAELEVIKGFGRKNLLKYNVQLESQAKKQEENAMKVLEKPLEDFTDKEVKIEELKMEPLSILDKLIESEEKDEKVGDISGK